MSKLPVQIYSKLYIHKWDILPILPVNAKYLILAGNICQLYHPFFFTFLDYCSSNWEKVYYIPGNIEFYSEKYNMNELDFQYKYKISNRYKNIYYLNNECAELKDNIYIYGTVLWTPTIFSSTTTARYYLSDYNKIKYFNTKLNYNTSLNITYVEELSKSNIHNLDLYLQNTTKKVLFVTYFPLVQPLNIINENNNIYDVNNVYYNREFTYYNYIKYNVKDIYANMVIGCIIGQNQTTSDIYQNNIRLISNPLITNPAEINNNICKSGIYYI